MRHWLTAAGLAETIGHARGSHVGAIAGDKDEDEDMGHGWEERVSRGMGTHGRALRMRPRGEQRVNGRGVWARANPSTGEERGGTCSTDGRWIGKTLPTCTRYVLLDIEE